MRNYSVILFKLEKRMPATKQQNVDYEWYQKNLKKIYKTFGNKYIVIYK